MSFSATRILCARARTHSRIYKICIKDIMFHGRNNLARGPHNPDNFRAIALCNNLEICKSEFFF